MDERATGRGRTAVRRLVRSALWGLAGLVGLVGLSVAGLLIRLAAAPLDLGLLIPSLETVLSAPEAGRRVEIGRLVLSWDGPGAPLQAQAEALAVHRDGTVAASAAGVRVKLPLFALLSGRVRPSHGLVQRPELLVVRGRDGAFRLALQPEQAAAASAGAGPDERGVADWAALLGAVQAFEVQNATATVRDAGLGTVWTAHADRFQVRRHGDRLTGQVALRLEYGPVPMRLEAHFALTPQTEDGTLDLTVRDLQPLTVARLIDVGGIDPAIALDLPVNGTVQARFAGTAVPAAVTVALESDGGTAVVPGAGAGPLRIESLRVAFEGRPQARTLAIDTVRLALSDPAVTLTADARLVDAAEGLGGPFEIRLEHADATARLLGRFRPGTAGDRTAWSVADLRFEGFDPHRFAGLVPALAPLAEVRVAVSGGAVVGFSRSFEPLHALLDLSVGPGSIALPDADARAAGLPSRLTLGGLQAVAHYQAATRRLTVPSLAVTLAKPALGISLSGGVSLDPDAPEGRARLLLAAGSGTAPTAIDLTLAGVVDAPAAPYRLEIGLDRLQPSRFAALAEVLAPLGDAALPISGTITLAGAPDGAPKRATLDLSAGPGRLHIPGFLAGPIRVDVLAVAGTVAWPLLPAPALLRVDSLKADFGGPRFEMTGTARLVEAGIDVEGDLRAYDVGVDRLPALWPIDSAKGARAWVLEHVESGFVPEARLQGAGIADLADPGEILARFAKGSFEARDVAVRYFGEMPPITGVSGKAWATEKTTMVLETTGGRIGDVEAGPGRIVITKLNEEDQDMVVTVPLSGPVRTTLDALDREPLRLGRKMEIAPRQVSGRHESTFTLALPLISDVDFEDTELRVEGRLIDLAIRDVRGDFDLAGADLALQVTNETVTAKGRGAIDTVPAAIDFAYHIPASEPVEASVKLSGRVPVDQLRRYGARLAPTVTGAADALALIRSHRSEGLSVNATLDLTDTVIALPAIGYSKPAGQGGQLRFVLGFERSLPVTVTNLLFNAGGLSALGLAKLDPTGTGWPERVLLTDLSYGLTRLRGAAQRTGRRAYAIQLFGDQLDGQQTLAYLTAREEADDADGAAGDGGSDDPPARWPVLQVQGQVGRLLLGPGTRRLNDALFKLHHDGERWDAFTLNGRMEGSLGSLRLILEPDGDRQAATVRSDDAGTFLRLFGVTETIQSGDLALIGAFDPRESGSPMTGRFAVKDFKVVGAPLLARLLNALSISGLMELLTGEGLSFQRLQGGYTLKEAILTVSDLRAAGPALGLTLNGRINLKNTRLAAQGTVVPAYTVNRVLGLIPFLGNLLSGGEGQGVFAATYRMTGTLAEPDIAVNPLSILAPGFVRNLFFLDKATEAEDDLYDVVPPAQ